ncbi:kinase-like domain-containing protein [Xylariaceae sp. AK1471]|nr:kinase-like domain-containing protein [Xylariaceae sp. AK1471]
MWHKRFVERGRAWANLLGSTPNDNTALFRKNRRRLREVRNYFTNNYAAWTFRNCLGYGGNGMALKFRHTAQDTIPLNFVMKVDIGSWESWNIREEEEATKKVARAAHCIQMIPRQRIGLPRQRKFKFDLPPNDSSSEGESSGDESRDDNPGIRRANNSGGIETRTRREIIQSDRTAANAKTNRYNDRITAAERRRADRQERKEKFVEAAQRGGRPSRASRILTKWWDLERKDFLLLEFCEFGDLEHLLYRLNEEAAIVPNRILWAFWLCLVRACIAMEYPPRKFHPRRREKSPDSFNAAPGVQISELGKVVGQDLYEDIPPPRRRWAGKQMVHFDIDPRNIFISGLDVNAKDNEHKLIPRLKLADFGLAKEIKPRKTNEYYSHTRDAAKWGYYAPEQFGAEWDYIKQPNGSLINAWGPEISEQKIAGQYGPSTNVWGIALVLWQLITKYEVPVPPPLQPNTVEFANVPRTYCPLLLTDEKYERVDIRLRETIARCMAHDPKDRPSLQRLLGEAKKGIDRVFANEPDRVIRKWVDTHIYSAPMNN